MVIIRSHDALVRFVFGEPEQMAELLRAHLPPALVGAIRWPMLRRVEGTFVDKALQERRTDMLFEARMGDAAVLLYVLHEHKSEPDPFAALQLAGYTVRILEQWRAENHVWCSCSVTAEARMCSSRYSRGGWQGLPPAARPCAPS